MASKVKSKRPLAERLIRDGLCVDRDSAERLIRAGLVRVSEAVVDKPGTVIDDSSTVSITPRREFVGRGALKLEAALDKFAISVAGLVCADVGACTGGFSDVLLRAGAGRVYAIDVGYGDLDWRIRTDPRVVVMERTNARYVQRLPEPISFACIDVSFISLTQILPSVCGWLAESATIIALVKPQFEAAREDVGEGGIVRDPDVHQRAISKIKALLPDLGLNFRDCEPSPILGAEGNKEFLLWCERNV
jgi:23S rRNA (cytidine1920-2'-O)/16S rRNA (cytidine1409-2'-O)-methyltransferase